MAASWSIEAVAADRVRMTVRGEIDLADERPLIDQVDALLADGLAGVVLDLADVTFVDSSGIRALVRLRQTHADRVRLGPISEPVRRVLEITGLNGLYADPDEQAE